MVLPEPRRAHGDDSVSDWPHTRRTYDEVLAQIRAVGCDCPTYDDRGFCHRLTDPADYALGREIGSPVACHCVCHDIWEEWIDEEEG